MMQESLDIVLADLQINFVEFQHEQMHLKAANDFSVNFNSIQFICEGYGWIGIDGQTYDIEKGDIMLLPANAVLSYGPQNGKPNIVKYFCHFNSDIGSQNLFSLISFDAITKTNDYEKTISVFHELERLCNDETFAAILKKKQLILELIGIWLEAQPQAATFKKPEDNIAIIITEYINNNISNNITVAQLAALFGYNVNYFTSLFKSYTNTTPKQYIINVKLKEALSLLRNMSLSISEIADKTGFVNQYYFSTSFKKKYGISPTQYRDALINGHE